MKKELEMIDIKIKELKPAKYNPRKNLRKCDPEYEKKVSYDDATELIAHFEKKGYVTKSGK